MSDPMPMMSDRLPAHSIEAEQGVLGCILLDPQIAILSCLERLPSSDVFYDLRHQALYDALVGMYDKQDRIDPITLQQRLRDQNQLEALGGMSYIAGLMNCAPAAASIEHYVTIVRDKYVLRSLTRAGTEIARMGYESVVPAEALEEAEKSILAIGKSMQTGAEDRDIKSLVIWLSDELDTAINNQGVPRGLTVGFHDLDSMTSGFRGGQLIVLAARPGVGKTSFAMNMAEHVAVDQKIPVGVFSLEMSSEELVFRLASTRARVNSKHARDGVLDERDVFRLQNKLPEIAKSPLHICDRSGLTIGQLSARARRMYQQHKVKFIVIDYIQLMQGNQRTNRNEQLTIISNGLKSLAKELNIPILVLSQLNREVTKENRAPRISDLRECGAIEQDADIIILLDPHRPKKKQSRRQGDVEPDDDDKPIPEIQEVMAHVPKNRNGPVNSVRLVFFRTHTKFETSSKTSDVPS